MVANVQQANAASSSPGQAEQKPEKVTSVYLMF